MSIDIIGTIYTPGEYDEQGAVIVAPEPLPGWHIITTAPISGARAYESQDLPPRIFAGARTLHYVFEDEEQARAVIGWNKEVGFTPEFEDKSLEDLLAAKLERINEAKNVALDAGFLLVLGEGEEARAVLFDSDAKARLAYLELAVKLGQTPAYSTPWKASRGQWVTMDAALFAALQPAYEAHIQTCFAWQAAREQDVAAALALVTPILGPSTPVLDENGNQVFNEDGTEAWAPGEPTGEMDETAARAALETISEAV